MVQEHASKTGIEYDYFMLLRPDWAPRKLQWKKVVRIGKRRARQRKQQPESAGEPWAQVQVTGVRNARLVFTC